MEDRKSQEDQGIYPAPYLITTLDEYTNKLSNILRASDSLTLRTLSSFVLFVFLFFLPTLGSYVYSVISVFRVEYYYGLVILGALVLYILHVRQKIYIRDLKELTITFDQFLQRVSQLVDQGRINEDAKLILNLHLVEATQVLEKAKRKLKRRWQL